jgi:hypothetical protein
MKLTYKLLLILLIPVNLFAQSAAVVKKQANDLANAFVKGDYKTLVDHMYPKLVQQMGGKEKMVSMASASMAQVKAQGIVFESATIGEPGKFYKAGTEIHCLVPETIKMKLPNGHVTAKSNLLAVSADKGKTWTFLDLNKNTISNLPKLFPNFNHDLVIPEPTAPAMSNN